MRPTSQTTLAIPCTVSGVVADPLTGAVYVALPAANAVAMINGLTNHVTATIPAIARDRNRVLDYLPL
jgi:DNA-binding beta-propeller fold protein YncE